MLADNGDSRASLAWLRKAVAVDDVPRPTAF